MVLKKAYDLFDATTPTSQNPKDNRLYNVDVAAEIKYLRAFCYPSYKDIDSYKTSFPPPIAILAIPGLRLSDAVTGLGDDVIYAVMTGVMPRIRYCFQMALQEGRLCH